MAFTSDPEERLCKKPSKADWAVEISFEPREEPICESRLLNELLLVEEVLDVAELLDVLEALLVEEELSEPDNRLVSES